ncbi:hypothetical protein CBL_02168 [Carabus blaptoides fortunei]
MFKDMIVGFLWVFYQNFIHPLQRYVTCMFYTKIECLRNRSISNRMTTRNSADDEDSGAELQRSRKQICLPTIVEQPEEEEASMRECNEGTVLETSRVNAREPSLKTQVIFKNNGDTDMEEEPQEIFCNELEEKKSESFEVL